tara:strand:- start:2858 stop:3106 length:249 start_codon:yes stop_codon:yes gene_type:complete
MANSLQKGDLVKGKKPWNKGTIVGVVIEHNTEATIAEAHPCGTFKIFWLNDKAHNEFTSKHTFATWEVMDSLERIENVKERT